MKTTNFPGYVVDENGNKIGDIETVIVQSDRGIVGSYISISDEAHQSIIANGAPSLSDGYRLKTEGTESANVKLERGGALTYSDGDSPKTVEIISAETLHDD